VNAVVVVALSLIALFLLVMTVADLLPALAQPRHRHH
jgi:ABC-type dipeptide/oligopeptide/nickel transport system permease component